MRIRERLTRKNNALRDPNSKKFQITKRRAKGALFIFLILIGIVISFYFSGFMNLVLTRSFYDVMQLRCGAILKSLLSNKNHFLLFICTTLLMSSIIAVALLLNRRETYESDTSRVTETIQVPVKVGQGQHGTAKWLPAESYSHVFSAAIFDRKGRDVPEAGGLVVNFTKLPDGREEVHFLSEDIHSCVIGATRSGKTRSLVLQSIVLTGLAGESMILSDPKGELYSYTAPFLQSIGYEVIALDFKNPLKSHRYNFLQPVIDAVQAGDTAKAVDLTWDITSALVGDESYGEKIWQNGEAAVIAGAVMAVVFDNQEHPAYQNLTNVYHFILHMCKTEGSDMPINKYIKEIDDTHPAKALFGIAQIAPSRTRGSFFTSALTTLRLFTNENIYSQTCRSDFTLGDTGRRKRAIFIILPDEKPTFYSLASLFVYQNYVSLVDTADARGGRLEKRVEFFLEEFGNFTKIEAFAGMLTVGGGRGMRFHIFIQSFAQIDEKYGREAAETVKDNCHAWIYLKTSNIATAETISKKLGQYTTSSYSKSSSYNSGGSYNANVSASMNLIARPLLTEDEVMRIERPYTLVMYTGCFPALTRLPDLSMWSFNALLGMGDKEHNRLLREEREKQRALYPVSKIELWGVWKEFAGQKPPASDASGGKPERRPPAVMTEYERRQRSRYMREALHSSDETEDDD